MSAAKFTPGPWTFAFGGGHALIFQLGGGPTFAGVPFDSDEEIPQAEANARLIAAAPELLEALHAADQTFAQNGLLACHAARQQISAAILKATGGEA